MRLIVLAHVLIFYSYMAIAQLPNLDNKPPTIDDIPNYGPIAENSGLHSITLTGIGPGAPNEKQQVSIVASSDNEILIPNITVEYEQGETAILSFTLGLNANGDAKITVTLDDGQWWRNLTEKSFDVNVFAVNSQPTFQLSTDFISIDDNPGRVEIANFAVNIDDGDPEERQKLKFVTKVLSTTGELAFRSNPEINKKNGDLKFECEPNRYGEALVSVVLEDDGGTKNGGIDKSEVSTFTIKVGLVNNPPTLDDIADPLILLEDAGEQDVELSGISDGGDGESQELTLSATSDNMDLIPDILIEYDQGATIAQLKFVTSSNSFGNANITVTVDDGQSINNKISKQFFVVVNPVADTPEVTDAVLQGSKQTSSGLVISRNPIDGDEVTHFKISNIRFGKLFHHDGVTEIEDNTFITYAEGNSGLKYTIEDPGVEAGIFDIQAATGPDDSRLGGEIISAYILLDNEAPSIISRPDSIVEISVSYVYNVVAEDPDESDVLTFDVTIPPEIQSWLKVIENSEGSVSIIGTPPQYSEGTFEIIIRVEDQFSAFDEQSFNLTVREKNKEPEILTFSIEIDEDETFYFSKDQFTSKFLDADGDSLYSVKAAYLPEFGTLKFNGTPVGTDTEIKVNEIENLAYIPDQDYFGLDVFDWNASDGKDFAIVPKRVSVFITSVNDPPEIVDFEESGLVFEYGDESITVTNTAVVRDADGDRLTKALVSISQNFVMGEDSLYYDRIEELNFDWQDSIGVLTISGISTVDIYQEAIRSLKYVNLKRLSPTGSGREIEIVLYDLDTISIPYARQISFEDNFVELEIPNAFTPNGDDTNESWGIKNIDIYGSYEISVYSRSGLRVFESTLREKEWDGKYEGNLVPAGNYYYVISIDKFKKTYTGTVLVLR